MKPSILVCFVACFKLVSAGISAEACKQSAGDDDHNIQVLSRVFIGYGRMSDHVIYLPKSCLEPTLAPSREEWSMGGDGPSILGPSVYKSLSYRDVKCPPDKLNYDVIRHFANELVKNKLLPVECSDGRNSEELAVGIILVAMGYPTEAYNHYNKMSLEDVSCPAIYYGRALAYAKSGLSQQGNAENALNDYNTALKYIKSEEAALAILERRAEVYQAMGRLHEANNDYSRILKNNLSDPNIYMHRGSVLFLLEEYSKAHDDFQKSLDNTPDQPVAMHYQALCLYHMGRLKESITLFQDILKLKPDYTEVIQSLGQAYRELGEFDLAIENFNKALSVNPTDARSYRYKGHLQYNHGDADDALQSFKTCTSLEPFNEPCQFMKAVSLATMGQYYPAVKEFTKVMLNHPVDPDKPSLEYTRVIYLREWCRYMHSHLDKSIVDLCAETNLSMEFREHWVNSYPFNLLNYTEQPGIQPHIKDVETPEWDSLSSKIRLLSCEGYHMGNLLQYHDSEGFLGNVRMTLAMGLATLEVSQAVRDFFRSPKTYKPIYGKKLTWKTAFDIAVKWKRLVDTNQPILWLDQLPSTKSKPSSFVHHINLIKGDKYNIQYITYLHQVVDLMKKLVMDFTNAMSSSDYKSELERADDYTSLMKTIMKYGGPQMNDPGFMLGTKVPSVKDRNRKHLDGFMISLGSIDKNNYTVLSIDIATKRARTQQYHAELDFLWDKFTDDMKKSVNDESEALQDSLVNTVLSIAYYFYNFMPISEGSGVVSYATTLGLLLAVGQEVTGQMPDEKILEMDALLAETPEIFVDEMKSWMNLKRAREQITTDLPKIHLTFPTVRSCLQIVNIDLSEKCK
uniref:tetratricopeptide repeat protein 13-like n=1 Tax=Styela clava TaxID=7725 RepID=UPI00193A292D|nr:tetratricopeptide repeat protein 13-like [Styela clava]